MEGRCVVDTLAELGCSLSASTLTLLGTAKVIWDGRDVVISAENNEVHIFNTEDTKLTAILQFPGPVVSIAQSEDKQLLYTACEKDGVYCVNLPSLISRVPSSSASQSPGPVLMKASPDWLAVREEGVCSLMLIGATLLTVSQRNSVWWFTLFSLPGSSLQTTCELCLPVVPAALCDDESKDHRGRSWRPMLACVSASSSSAVATLGDGHFLLEPVLFSLLFGVDAALGESPIVLCGLPDGRLCFFPLRFPGSRIRVLHSLEQPIAFIGTSVAGETRPGSCICMVAVGRHGRVVLVRTCDGGPEEGGQVAGFSEGYVSGPVVCACADSRHLYYSTGSDLLSLDLSAGRARMGSPGGGEAAGHSEQRGQGPGGERWNKAAALQSPISLNVCRVIALAALPPTNNGVVELLGLSSRGRLHRISLPKGTDGGGVPSISSLQVGQRMRDLLAAIGDVCERGSVLKSALQSKKQNPHNTPTVPDKPIKCRVAAKWSRSLQRDCLSLTCVLENSSLYVLERGWTLCIRVLPLSRPLSPGADNSSTTFSFLFRKNPGDKLDVTLPLTTAGDTSFPMSVSCSRFSLQSLLGKDLTRLLANEDPPGLDSYCVSLALDTLTVDWLDVLQVGGAAHSSHGNVAAAETPDMITVRTFLNGRRLFGAGRTEKGGGSKTSDGVPFTASLRVSSELLRASLEPGPPGLDLQGPKKVPSPSLCSSVLAWLLSRCSGGLEARDEGGGGPQGGAGVLARGPGGHMVKLTATELTVDGVREDEEGPMAVVELRLKSSSIVAVCGLHHAVLRRVQGLLQGSPGKAGASVKVEGLWLRRALQRAEAALDQIRLSSYPEGFGSGASAGRSSTDLLSVYRQLRENPLLII
ncbi:LOW QUALITY PROTEIN: Fanconi anemia core complex-associated protein 100 [Aplochiton taeniatus]